MPTPDGLTAMRRCWWMAASICVACAPARPPVTPVSARARPETPPPVLTEAPAAAPAAPGAFVRALHLQCRAFDASCSSSVGMLARAAEPEAQRCTVSLIAPDRVITASHCLRPEERVAGASCRGEWVAFPGEDGAPMEWVACSEVERANAVDESSVMRNDVAVLRLAHAVPRPVLEVDPRPPEEGSIVTIVAVRPHPIYSSQHEIEGRRCRVATRQSASEVFGEQARAVGWLMNCPSQPGNSGSPVLDARGRIRALMHGGSAPIHGVGVTSGLGLLR